MSASEGLPPEPPGAPERTPSRGYLFASKRPQPVNTVRWYYRIFQGAPDLIRELLPERERLYIEAWDEAMRAEMPERVKTLTAKLQELVLKYPEDQEARVLFAMFSIEAGNQLGTELVVREVLKALPDHPGAHHTRIHNWDGKLAEQAIASCVEYGRVAPGIGHSNHMPGHNYSKLGMWHEAALSLDAATRVELRYMNERLALPFETWNYAHNRNYLCYIQEQLGMAEASLRGARDLLAAPLDPQRNAEGGYSTADQGMAAQVRALIKFERWDAILAEGTVAWRDDAAGKALRAYAETIAYAGLGRAVDARARLGDLKVLLKEQAASVPAEVMALDATMGIMIAETVEMAEKVRMAYELHRHGVASLPDAHRMKCPDR